MEVSTNHSWGKSMSDIKRIGIDLSRNSFDVCGVDSHEQLVIERTLKRHELLATFANLR